MNEETPNMFMRFSRRVGVTPRDVCVVGAGPVGIALALACEDRGLSVLLLESGGIFRSRFTDSLGAGHKVNSVRHASPDVAMRRGFGGTSRWWGGRCVPFDEIDFAPRGQDEASAWPINHDDVARWYPQATEYLGIGPANFEAPLEPWTRLDGACFRGLERWAPRIDMGAVHHERLSESSRITVLIGATVTRLHFDGAGDRVDRLTVSGPKQAQTIAPEQVVLACGGLETTRLLLSARQIRHDLFGGPDSTLGQYYMGHVSGKIADIVLSDPKFGKDFDFFQHCGAYVRRRFSLPASVQTQERLGNISFWADNPPFHAADHRNGALSLVWLALAVKPIGRLLASEGIRVSQVGPPPRRWLEHLGNVARAPIAAAVDMSRILSLRYLLYPPKPGFLLHSSAGRYSLHYHAEQSPQRDSQVTLSDRLDALGVPYLDVNLRFDRSDAQSVVRAHHALDQALRDAGLARLEYYDSDGHSAVDRVMAQAADGFHQIGSTRMGRSEQDSVVDADCRVHGVDNLHIASSSVFPSSGQANPTFPTIALAMRLAAHLASQKARLSACANPSGACVEPPHFAEGSLGGASA